MNRRFAHYFAAGALVLAGITGTVGSDPPSLLRGQPMDEPQFDLAASNRRAVSMTVTSGLEIISGNAVSD